MEERLSFSLAITYGLITLFTLLGLLMADLGATLREVKPGVAGGGMLSIAVSELVGGSEAFSF